MEFLLDTANLADVKEGLNWPVSGVTTNPSILKKEGKIDVYARLKEMQGLIGKKTLHVQLVSQTREEMRKEAAAILEKLGNDVFIKVPVSTEGLPIIKELASQGLHVTATAVYSTMQGILAVAAGAEYIAVYINRMENSGADPYEAIAEIADFIARSGSNAKVLGASFKNVAQVTKAFAAGAESATMPAAIVRDALALPGVQKAVVDFAADFEAIHGKGKTMATIA